MCIKQVKNKDNLYAYCINKYGAGQVKKAMHMYDEGKVAYASTIMLFCICVKVLVQGGKVLK